jgi:hypothetical protein
MEAVNLLIEIAVRNAYVTYLIGIGGPDRDRTDDLFHAMEARSQTAPQAHMLQGCNCPILSSWAPFVNATCPNAKQ